MRLMLEGLSHQASSTSKACQVPVYEQCCISSGLACVCRMPLSAWGSVQIQADTQHLPYVA